MSPYDHPEYLTGLRAVLERPDDDGPRLTLADWLERHGEQARAGFIRRQVASPRDELTFHGEVPTKDYPAFHQGDGLEWLTRTYRRGFVEAVWLTTAHYTERAEALFRAAPVR